MKKIVTAVIGLTVLAIGIALLVLPGPGLPIVAAGLAILGTEFLWARRALRNAKGKLAKLRRRSGLTEWLRARRARKR
jgi:tellurite resistance protein TerC